MTERRRVLLDKHGRRRCPRCGSPDVLPLRGDRTILQCMECLGAGRQWDLAWPRRARRTRMHGLTEWQKLQFDWQRVGETRRARRAVLEAQQERIAEKKLRREERRDVRIDRRTARGKKTGPIRRWWYTR